MADITMSKDETLELDVIIEESSRIGDNINIDRSDYDLNGLQTHTGVFNPQGTGQYTITVNGQELTVEVIGTNAIPDSEADQKLIHRYYLSDDSDPFVDQVGSYDGLSTGTTQVTGDWIDDAARSGDGVDDRIVLNGSEALDSLFGTTHAWAFSLQTTATSNDTIIGVSDSGMWFVINIGGNSRTNRSAPDGHLQITIREAASGNVFTAETDVAVNDGNPHRIVVNKTAENDTEFYIDQSSVSRTVTDAQGSIDTTGENAFDMPLFAFQDQSQQGGGYTGFLDGILDDVCVFNDSLTTTEAQSYSNPF